ncbi:putative Serine/threonine protein kinase [Planktothrix sp. PCC 11201]|uniref:serine/threonine-protein kinase n=1 Tax=Planktothrix sp. PCC 11201 TaxID=1729650 RepID=UPI00090EC3B7|nr:serine/threonine-protein kinase [Planktothrix sp. PCC 11201]SKB12872.1 putative Serine/threonine protein kinase [Planktothrix sp. PCC 11201]
MQASRYRILGLVGQGQFGKVYCASDRRTGQLVALKELSHQNAPTHQFLQELWFIISLQHPNIAACLGLEHIQTGRYLVMEYCEGGTLRHLVEQQNSLRLQEALDLIIGVLEGLDYAHQRGIIHCDIKPENILLTLKSQGWQPKLSDFGIARRLPLAGKLSPSERPSTFTGGSPAYMAPERFYGIYSPRSDIYAVGVVLFELLVGDRPFHGLPGELMSAHLNQRLQIPTEIPEALKTIIQKALEKLPARRYKTAAEMVEALRKAIVNPQIQSLADSIILGKLPDVPEDEQFSKVRVSNLTLSVDHSIPLPAVGNSKFPLNCITNFPYLYTGFGQTLKIWSPPNNSSPSLEETQVIAQAPIHFPEPILAMQMMGNGCCVMTKNKIYYATNFQDNPQSLLNLSGIQSRTSNHQESQNSDQVKAEKNNPLTPLNLASYKDLLYRVAIEPKGGYMALAFSGQLRFYSLTDKQGSPALKLIKKLSLSVPQIPELIFLDRRYLLGVWLNFKQKNCNMLRVYTRRGTPIGNLKLFIPLKQIIPTPQPYTVLGIGCDDQPQLILLHLKPLSIIRISLSSPPIIACATSWGYVIADQQGKYTFLNLEGKFLGDYLGPVNSQAITSWGKTGLAILTASEPQSYLHFVKSINLEQDL